MKKLAYFISLDPTKGLEKQPVFWVLTFSPVLLALYLGYPVWSEYTFSRTTQAYENFLEVSKLPIGISSLTIPIGVLIGRIHGTRQTAMQIEKAQRQIENTESDNKTKLFLAHYNSFMHLFGEVVSIQKDYGSLSDGKWEIKVDKSELYYNAFPYNSVTQGVSTPRLLFTHHIKALLREVWQSYEQLLSNKDPSEQDLRDFCFKTKANIGLTKKSLGLVSNHSDLPTENQQYWQLISEVSELAIKVIYKLESFDERFMADDMFPDSFTLEWIKFREVVLLESNFLNKVVVEQNLSYTS